MILKERRQTKERHQVKMTKHHRTKERQHHSPSTTCETDDHGPTGCVMPWIIRMMDNLTMLPSNCYIKVLTHNAKTFLAGS